jgi:uncharacterized protein YgiB involved in biofilm formation
MTHDEIIKLANLAKLPACHATHPVALKRFADLIRFDEREKCSAEYFKNCFDAVEFAKKEQIEFCCNFIQQMVIDGYMIGEALIALKKLKGEK